MTIAAGRGSRATSRRFCSRFRQTAPYPRGHDRQEPTRKGQDLMEINRRTLLSGATAGAAAAAASASVPALALPKNQIRLATEEAFTTAEHIRAMKKLVDDNPQVTRWDYRLWRMMTSNLLADTPARLLDLEDV